MDRRAKQNRRREGRRLLSAFPERYLATELLTAFVVAALIAFVVIATEAAARWVRNEFNNWFVCILAGGKDILAFIPDAVLASKGFQNKLRSLPPEVTAAELLRLRADILLQPPSR